MVLATGCGFTGYSAFRGTWPDNYFHTVQAGETLAAIGSRYNVEYERIALLNGIFDNFTLVPGQKLLIPAPGRIEAVRDTSPAAAKVAQQEMIKQYKGGKLLWPVAGGRFVSQFGQRWGRYHDGVDIAAPSGTAIFAAHDAEVIYSNNKLRGYGNLVVMRANDGLTTVYSHNRRNLVDVGDKVRRGTKIAEVGQTGRATGPHLHFEVRMKDRSGRFIAVDPVPFLSAEGPNRKTRYRVNENLTPIINKGLHK